MRTAAPSGCPDEPRAAPDRRDGRRALLGLAAAAATSMAAGAVPALARAAPAGAASAAPMPAPAGPAGDVPPPDPREFRAAWVATVAQIDWPSRPGLAPEAQRAEVRAIVERAQSLGLNALVLQVRPAGDAIYPSTLEPWSEYLTGAQGRAPAPAWDPLAHWIAEARARGLQLHAWVNPFRARHATARSALAPPHLALREPGVVRRYGDQLWMDPGEPAACAHTLAVVADLLTRYDLDGLHVDDYFYPYPAFDERGAELPFPDDAPYARYAAAGGLLARDDWRRANVDAIVQALQRTVRALRPQALFGISPFGIGRPDRRPPGITGFSQYDKLHADVERWFEEGWLDYLAPQLYWPVAREGQAFGVLLDYWLAANRRQRHLWPGLFTSAVRPQGGSDAPATPQRHWPARELIDQLQLTRVRRGAGGHLHFSMNALMADRDGLATLLQFGPYAQPALVPATPWLDLPVPEAPRLVRERAQVRIESASTPLRWAVWRRAPGGPWRFAAQPGAERRIAPEGADLVVVSAVGRAGQTSERHSLRLTPP